MESKENFKPTKSEPVSYPDNAQLTENDASDKTREKTCVQKKDPTAKEKEMARADNYIEPNASDIAKPLSKLHGKARQVL